MKVRILSIIYFFVIISCNKAPTPFSIPDSIEDRLMVLRSLQEDTSKVLILNKLAESYESKVVDSSAIYSLQAIILAKKLNYWKGLSEAYYYQGKAFQFKGNLDSAMHYYKKAIHLSDSLKIPKYSFASQKNLNDIYYYKGFFDLSEEKHLELLDLVLVHNDSTKASEILNTLSWIEEDRGDFDKASQYLKKSQLFEESQGEVSEGEKGINKANLANIQIKQRRFKDALKLLTEAKNHFSKIGNDSTFYLAKIDLSFAQVYSKMDSSRRAFQVGYSLIPKFTKLKANQELALTYSVLAETYTLSHNLDSALKYENLAKEIYYEIELLDPLLTTFNHIIMLHTQLGNIDSASNTLNEVKNLTQIIGTPGARQMLYDSYIEYYSSLQNWEEAFKYAALYNEIEDSTESSIFNEKMALAEEGYETREKDRKISYEQELKDQAISQKNTLLAILIVVCLLLAYIFKNNQKIKKQKQIIEDKNSRISNQNRLLQEGKEREETLKNEANHRIMNNLKTLNDYIENHQKQVKKGSWSADTALERLTIFIINMREVHRVLSINNESDAIDFKSYIEELILKFEVMYAPINITLQSQGLLCNPQKLSTLCLVVFELITNSYKHAFIGIKKPSIHITQKETKDSVIVKVSDNGTGLNLDSNINIDDSGSSIINRLVTKELEGSITSNSIPKNEGGGTTHSIIIPKDRIAV